MEDLVTDVKLNLVVSGNGGILAYGEVTLYDKIIVKVSIIKNGRGESFVSWPSYKSEKNGEIKWIQTVRFAELDNYKHVTECIMQAFNSLMEGDDAPEPVIEEIIPPLKEEVVSVKKKNVWERTKK